MVAERKTAGDGEDLRLTQRLRECILIIDVADFRACASLLEGKGGFVLAVEPVPGEDQHAGATLLGCRRRQMWPDRLLARSGACSRTHVRISPLSLPR